MSAAKVRRAAHAHLSYGYFQPSATEVYVRCPRCRSTVATTVVAWAKPRARCAALEMALAQHWEDCEVPP